MSTVRGLPLVTGASGFAGGHLLERLLQSHERLTGWASRSGRQQLEGGGRIQWQHVDLLDRGAVHAAVADLQPSIIFHCAGRPHVADSWANAVDALQVNALGTHHLLDAVAAAVPGSRTIVAGSALIYRPSERALHEDHPLGPTDPYGVSKLAQEMRALSAPTPVVAARPFNHIGPRQQPSFSTSSFARQIAEIEAGVRDPVLLVGNLDARRDLTDVRDTARAYEALGASGAAGRAYNICTGTALRVGDVLERMLGLSRVRITVRQDPARLRPSDNPVLLGDPSRIAAETGWRAEIPIEQTLGDVLAWWRTQLGA